MKEPDLIISQSLVRAILTYLMEKPYKEVIIIIQELSKLKAVVNDE